VLKETASDGEASYQELAMQGRAYTWSGGETLVELLGRRDEIEARHATAMLRAKVNRSNIPLIEVLSEALDEDDDTAACTICAL
jgi:hypothetical protein